MGILSYQDAARVAAIGEELNVLRLDGSQGIAACLPEVTAVTGLETTVVYSLRRETTRIEVARWEDDRCPVSLTRAVTSFFTTAAMPVFYDLVRPEASQRNRVVEATTWIGRLRPGTWEASDLCREVFAPQRMVAYKQLRVLVCEGPVLLGWFGGLQAAPVSNRQRAVLRALIPAMRRRLSVERRLQVAPGAAAVLEVVMEQLSAPAFVVGPRGEVHEMNAAGRALLRERGRDLGRALTDAIARRPSAIAFELREVRENGRPGHYLAIARLPPEARMDARVHAAAARWRLTPRQVKVLELLTRGIANATIAAQLGIGERAVELHVTAMFDRFGADSRSALVARVLAA